MRIGDGRATLGLAGPDGLALVETHRGRAALRGSGPGGVDAARRLAGQLAAWAAHGRPTAAALRLTAVPSGVPAPPVPPEAVVLEKRHCTLLVG